VSKRMRVVKALGVNESSLGAILKRSRCIRSGALALCLMATGSVMAASAVRDGMDRDAFQAEIPSLFSIGDIELSPPPKAVSVRAPLQVRLAQGSGQSDLCQATATLIGPNGAESLQPSCTSDALDLRLAHDLVPAARYTLVLQWAGSGKLQTAAFSTLAVKAGKAPARQAMRAEHGGLQAMGPGIEEWRPDPSRRDPWYYAWGERTGTAMMGPLPSAPAGHTGVSGRLARFNGMPIAEAKVSLGALATQTDAQGRFLLPDVPSGPQVLQVDGTQVVIDGGHYTKHSLHVDIAEGQTTALQRPIYLARVDPATEVSLASPSERDVLLTHPAMPGVEVRIPKGTVLRQQDGSIVTKVSLTPVPLDRTPYATPMSFPLYFTLQPGGAFVDPSSDGPVQVTYPNREQLAAGQAVDFWNYDPRSGWKVYGHGKASADGRTIVADAGSAPTGLALREIMTFGYAVSTTSPPPGPKPGGERGGDPVDLATGIYVTERTDLFVKDVMPLSITRSYQPFNTLQRAFGPGWSLAYEMTLVQGNNNGIDLVLADLTRIPMSLQSDGVTRKCTSVPAGAFHGATLSQIINPRYPFHPNQWQVALRDQTKLRFDGHLPNQLLEIEDRNGNMVTITRDQGTHGNITRITSPNGRYIRFTYADGRISQVTDNAGRVVNYVYDTSGTPRLVGVADADQTHLPAGQQALVGYTYDPQGRLWTIKDKRGNTAVTNLYHASGKMQQQTLADGKTWGYAYGTNSMTLTNPRGIVTEYGFNASGYVNRITVGKNATVPFAPQVTTILRDANNLVISSTDPLGRVTDLGYDGAGNVSTVTRLANTSKAATQRYGFDGEFNQLVSVTNEVGATTAVDYDAFGNLASVVTPLGKTWTFSPNDQGLVQQVVSPLGATTRLDYNLADLASLTDAEGRTVRFGSDELGRVHSITDPSGHLTQFTYDKKDRVTGILDALGQSTAMGYDANGNLLSVLLPGHQNAYGFGYDPRNRSQTQTDPLGRSASATLDGNGNAQQLVDAKAQLTTSTFDPFDRPRQVTFHDGSTVKYTFDAGNRLTQVVDSLAGTTSIALDGHDHPAQVTSPHGALKYQFDATGRMQWIQYPSGLKVTYGHDAANQVKTVQVGGDAPFLLSHDDDGRLGSLTQPNGTVRSQGYNSAGQVLSIAYANAGTVLGDWTHDYDSAGRLQTSAGSLIDPVAPLVGQTATFDDANQIATLNGGAVGMDANGSQLSDAGMSFTYDARGRLRTATAGGLTATYTVGPFGLRDTKVYNGATTHYLYDLAGHLVVETDAAHNTLREYVWIGDTPVMVRVFSGGTATAYYVWSDHLNTPRVVTDVSNNLVWRWDSDAYGNGMANGNPRNITGANFVFNLRFPGQYFDAETGLHYNAARDYSPRTGRYVQSDPIGLTGGINTYAYVNGSPVSTVDPTGEFGIAGAVWGAGIDLGLQLLMNGGSLKCVNWKDVGLAAVGGAVGAGLLNGVGKLKNGSNTWSATSKWLRSKNGPGGPYSPQAGQQYHHWAIEQNSAIGKMVPDSIKNQPWNLNPISKTAHELIHGNAPGGAQYGATMRWWQGTPGWAKGVEMGLGTAVLVPDNQGDNCECQ
jgi:RHS repeat-associated protein